MTKMITFMINLSTKKMIQMVVTRIRLKVSSARRAHLQDLPFDLFIKTKKSRFPIRLETNYAPMNENYYIQVAQTYKVQTL
mmetsp:Transcript_5286/g.7833  ORF Transcript_5286/g.7833 Transcript_5286/m.7833 type:complete len:81 (-) Transcript_5286:350-592(-)